ncbi:MAG: carbon monoxide dehydrogenase, partial [Gammaproteobacteria bacterium]|nr:carbon monoxide dehydrogenase [Gammaproteobacteria bacterium]NIO62821.1 carbon monoxide dehydrogenase [Gammaproteobacteria bacterium]
QGIADVNLIDKDNETTLAYTIKFNVRGKLAQVGSRLLYNGIEKISKEFFTSLAKGINNSDAEK